MKTFRTLGWAAVFLLAANRDMCAQDTTIIAPAFFDLTTAAEDKPPQLKSRPRISWPDELEKSDQPSYVLIALAIDSKGKITARRSFSANAYFERSVADVLSGLQFVPASRGGQPSDEVAWMAVIFNPRAAKENARDASPRLMAVSPVLVTKNELQGEKPPTVWTTFHVDEMGVISIARFDDPLHERFRAKLEETLSRWRFLPAKKSGVAIASDVHVPVEVFTRPPFRPEVKQTAPKLIYSEKPIYPRELQQNQMKGEVVVALDISPEGRVLNPVISRSSNPAFDQPAIEAVLKWKFEPATRDGKPVAIKMLQPISFALEGLPNGGRNLYEIENSKKLQAKLPEELRYDVPPKLEGVLLPTFPYSLFKDGVSGSAKVRFLIDENGKVSLVKVVEATKAEFGLAMVAAVEAFHFIPAMKGGRSTLSAFSMESKFELGKVDPDDRDLLRLEKKHPEAIVAKGLDRPPKPLSQRSPIFPSALAGQLSEGTATIELLVDTTGRARLPKIISASEPSFGYAAAQAVPTWRFEVPTVKGRPVVARVQVPIAFSLKSPDRPGETPAKAAPTAVPLTGAAAPR